METTLKITRAGYVYINGKKSESKLNPLNYPKVFDGKKIDLTDDQIDAMHNWCNRNCGL